MVFRSRAVGPRCLKLPAKVRGGWLVPWGVVAAIGMMLGGGVPQGWAAPLPKSTTTTLAITPGGPVAAGTMVTLTATVTYGGITGGSFPVTTGQVIFCNVNRPNCTDINLLGTAQLTPAGTATLKFIPGLGAQKYQAVFLGTPAYTTSPSGIQPLTVTGSYPTTSILAVSGSTGDYTLTDTVTSAGVSAPTGSVSFLDKTNIPANYVLATAALVTSTLGINFGLAPGTAPAVGTNPGLVAVGDFDGNGVPDMAVVNQGSNNVTILLGIGDGTFKAAIQSPVATGNKPNAIAVGDFNGDGFLDLAVLNDADDNVTILLGDGAGNFAPAPFPSPATGVTPDDMVAGDFNGDGIEDLAIANTGSDSVTVLLGNGDGSFTPGVSTGTGGMTSALAVGDFNGDGIPDLAVTTAGANAATLVVLLGNGDGTFHIGTSLSAGTSAGWIVVGDINTDGKADVVVSQGAGDTAMVFLGNGNGTFTAAPTLTTGNAPDVIALGDFNQDGKPDLAVSNSLSQSVWVFLGNGDGTFTQANNLGTVYGSEPAGVAVADFNGDGIPDIAAVNAAVNNGTYNNVSVFLTGGASSTATATGISPVGTATHMVDAMYAGAGLFGASLSNVVTLTAEKVATTVVLTANPGNVPFGQPVVLTAMVSPSPAGAFTEGHSPSGTVSFYNGSTLVGTGIVNGGVATLSTTALPGGNNCDIYAVYPGDTNFLTSTSISVCVLVTGTALQTITFPQPVSPAYAGTSVTLMATASPSGIAVTYKVISGPAIVNGSTLTYTGAGPVVVEADAAGNVTYAAAAPVQDSVTVTVLNQPVEVTGSTLTIALNFSTAGTIGNINVLTQGAPNLDYNLVSGGSCAVGAAYTAGQLCTVEYSFTPTHPGPRYGGVTLTASGGALLANSYIFGIGVGPQVIWAPGTQSTLATGFNFPAHIAVDASGNVFVADAANNAVKEILAAGGYTTINTLGSGFQDPLGVAVDGSGNIFVGGQNAVKEILAAGGYTIVNTLINIPSVLAPAGMVVDGGGNVFFADDGSGDSIKELTVASGYTTVNIVATNTGGDVSGLAMDASGNLFVASVVPGAVKEFSAASGYTTSTSLGGGFSEPFGVAVDLNGNVFVADGSSNALKQIPPGCTSASCVITLNASLKLPYGLALDGSGNLFVADNGNDRLVKLDYADPPSLSFATTVVGQTSSDSPQTVTMTNDGNASLLFTSTALNTADPLISAGFTLGGSSTCLRVIGSPSNAPLAAGASCTDAVSFTPVTGGNPITGTLVTSDNNLNSIASVTQTVHLNGKAIGVPPTIVFAVPNHTYGDAPFTVAATSNSTGAFTYSVVSGPATISGAAVTLTGAGTVVLVASEAASGNYGAGTQNATFTVYPAVPTVGVKAAPSPVFVLNPVTLSVSVSSTVSTPTGSVIFYDGSNALGPATLSGGGASLSVSTLAVGPHSITAAYSGDSNFTAAVSPAVVVVVEDFTLSISNPNVTIAHGGTANYTLVLNPVGGPGMAAIVSLSVTGVPDNSTMTLTPVTIATGSGATNVTLVIATPDYPVGPWGEASLGVVAVCGLLLSLGRRRRRVRWLGCVVLLLSTAAALTTLAGCGSGWGPQHYPLTVTATSGQLSRTASAALTSQ